MIGYVYKIISNETDKCYVGSTIQNINTRFSQHKSDYKNYINGNYYYVSSFDIIKNDDVIIVVIDEIEFEDKQELHKLEGKYIRELNCVNKIIPNRTQKEYNEVNKDKIKEYKKKWMEENKDKIKQQKIEYRDKNKDKIKQQRKEYYEKNKK